MNLPLRKLVTTGAALAAIFGATGLAGCAHEAPPPPPPAAAPPPAETQSSTMNEQQTTQQNPMPAPAPVNGSGGATSGGANSGGSPH
jgi:hypothetical protein